MKQLLSIWLFILFSAIHVFGVSNPSVTFSKSFSGSADPGQSVTLTFTLTNPESYSISDLTFTDDLDACLTGLIATNTPLNNICGPGSQLSGTSVLILTGGNLPANGGTASFDVTVLVPENAAAGTYTNTTSELLFYGVPASGPVSADLTVNDTPLPVQLYDLQANSRNNSIQLQWTVQNEVDILGYTIDRKTKHSGWSEIASFLTDKNLKSRSLALQEKYTWTDNDIKNNTNYSYRLSHTNINGMVTSLRTVEVNPALPEQTIMYNAYPNPFNPETTIRYQILKDSWVEITIYNLLGGKVKQLVRNSYPAGSYKTTWDGTTDSGQQVPSGVYFVKMQTPDYKKTHKIIFTK